MPRHNILINQDDIDNGGDPMNSEMLQNATNQNDTDS